MTTRKGVEAPNFTAVPNRLFQIFPLMREAELRCTLAIARETFGWRRDRSRRLSLSLLMTLTGLSRQGVLTGTEAGIKRGTLERFEVRDHRNRKTFEYELLVLADDASCGEVDRSSKLTGQANLPVNEVDQSPVNEVDRYPVQPVNEVDTLKERTNKQIQEKEKREAAAPPALSGHPQKALEEPTPPQTPPADAGAPDGASEAIAEPVQVPVQPTANAEPSKATSTEKVPGGGAAARAERGETETWLRRKLSNPFIDRLLEELPPLGVDRRRDWFALPLPRVEELAAEAQRQATKDRKVPTCLRDLLDEECRRNVPVRAPAAASETADPDADPLAALLAGTSLNGNRSRR